MPSQNGGFWGIVQESFAGAWQRNMAVESTENVLAFSAVYACVSLIAGDISKLRIMLTERKTSGVWAEVLDSPLLPVLRKPNNYQTRIQFIEQWIVSKLLYGNTYVYKERDQRHVVVAMYVLDPRRVTPLVADSGDVYYQLQQDNLAGRKSAGTIAASEIIHDRGICPFHPLVGVSPIYACALSSTQGLKIQANSQKFFENMSRPSGHLTAPGQIKDDTALRMKNEFEKNFGGGNIGRLLVTGDGLKYEPMTIPAQEAQLIEQLKWTVEDVARCFHVPLHMLVSGQAPGLNNVGALNQAYYTQTLQAPIEAIEILLDEGLNLGNVPGKTYGTEMDLDGLLRMDPLSRADAYAKAIQAGYLKPNEARFQEDMDPVEGGDTPYLQQQNYSLAALAKRDSAADPFGSTNPAPLAPVPPATDVNPPDNQPTKEFSEMWLSAVIAHSGMALARAA